jgi:hypothetical protein
MSIPSGSLPHHELRGQKPSTVTVGTATNTSVPRVLLTRADALALLRIGETTLHWLQKTGKLKPIRIGSRVLFNASEIKRIATHGASLSKTEKEAAAKRERKAIDAP